VLEDKMKNCLIVIFVFIAFCTSSANAFDNLKKLESEFLMASQPQSLTDLVGAYIGECLRSNDTFYSTGMIFGFFKINKNKDKAFGGYNLSQVIPLEEVTNPYLWHGIQKLMLGKNWRSRYPIYPMKYREDAIFAGLENIFAKFEGGSYVFGYDMPASSPEIKSGKTEFRIVASTGALITRESGFLDDEFKTTYCSLYKKIADVNEVPQKYSGR
jgi:hypothetical protein